MIRRLIARVRWIIAEHERQEREWKVWLRTLPVDEQVEVIRARFELLHPMHL